MGKFDTCIECRKPVRNNESVCRQCLDVETEMLVMLQEPTFDKVRRYPISAIKIGNQDRQSFHGGDD